MARAVLVVTAAAATLAGAAAFVLRSKSKKDDSALAPPKPTGNTSVVRLSKDGKRPEPPAAAAAPAETAQPRAAVATFETASKDVEASQAPEASDGSTDLAAVKTCPAEQKLAKDTKQDVGTPVGSTTKPRKPSGELVGSIVASIEKGKVSKDAAEPEPAAAAAAPATAAPAHVAAAGTKHDRSDSPKAPATVQENLLQASGRVDSKGHLVKKPKQEGEGEVHAEKEQESRDAAPAVASEAPPPKAEPAPKAEVEKAAPSVAAPDATVSSKMEAPAPKAETEKSAPAEPVAAKEEVVSASAKQVEEPVSAVNEGEEQAEEVAVKDLVERAFVKDFVAMAFKNAVAKAEVEMKAASSGKGAIESPERKASPSKASSNKAKSSKKASGSTSAPVRPAGKKPKPNDPCPCGRYFPAKKYKKCCGVGGK